MPHHRQGLGSLNGTGSGLQLQTGRIGRNYEKIEKNSTEIEFKPRTHQEDDSGYSSPPLWKTSQPVLTHQLPLTSRSWEIAKGRQEMMEMVEGMPESAYELSLKDLVESPLNQAVWQSPLVDVRGEMVTKTRRDNRRDLRRKVENGPFLLKMFFPVSVGSKKSSSGTGKVSPRPPSVAVDGEKVLFNKSVDGEWWKKSPYAAAEGKKNRGGGNRSSGSSNSSGRSRDMGGTLPGCWSFFPGKRKAGEPKQYLF